MAGFDEEFEVVSWLVRQAGRILLDNYGNPRGIERKSDGTLVTGVDRDASELISSSLMKQFPGYGILDEERQEDGTRFSRKRCWVVDPLDGTVEYIEETGDFGIIVGLLDGFRPVFGVTYKPHKDELAYAARGQGAYLLQGGEAARLSVSESDELHVLISRIRSSEELDTMLARLEPDSVTYMGGSLKTIEIARGDATLFLCPTTSRMALWDLCAPSVILEEAGGRISDVHGNPFNYQGGTTNYKGVVATNRRIHDAVLNRISML